MEFDFYISKILEVDEEGFTVLNARKLPQVPNNHHISNSYGTKKPSGVDDKFYSIYQIVNKMGEASAKVFFLIFMINFISHKG